MCEEEGEGEGGSKGEGTCVRVSEAARVRVHV